MENYKLFDGEFKFISIIWEVEPVNSTELVKLCYDRLGWKKSTMYTMLKRLVERGLVQNDNATVTTLVKREQAQQYESEILLNKMFDGSVPSFVTSFLQGRTLSEAEAQEIRQMINSHTEDKCNG